MHHEAPVTDMELQLFNGDNYCLRINSTEALWDILLNALRQVQVLPDGHDPGDDFLVEGAHLAATLQTIEETLRGQVDQWSAMESSAGGYDQSTIVVFDRPLQIRVRDPRHYAIKRINSLRICLQQIMHASQRAQFFVVPDLSNLDHKVISVIESVDRISTENIAASLLRTLINQRSESSNPATRQSLDRDIEDAKSADILGNSLSRLVRWGILDRDPDGNLRATGKLRTILH